jgi:hypothetical protein
MSYEYSRRGRNWYTAMGVLFIVAASIVLVRNLIIWGPGFMLDFFLSSDITNEKISFGMIVFGCILIVIGFRKFNE